MKILVLVACVLTIATMVYTDDVKVQKFGDDFVTCADTLNLPKELSVQVIKCIFEKNSLIDEQGVLKKNEILRYFDNIISNQQLQQIGSCIDYGENRDEESNDKKTLAAIQCIRFKLSTLTKNY